MGRTVEIYLSHPGPTVRLVHRVAETLGVPGSFYPGGLWRLSVDADRWIGAENWGQLSISDYRSELDWDDVEPCNSAYAPYQHELSLELRGPVQRLGRALFDRLTELALPMVYGDYLTVFADFLPGRGIRDFPPGTAATDKGRDLWYEPAVHAGPPTAESPGLSGPPTGGAVLFETGRQLHLVPVVQDGAYRRWAPPVAQTFGDAGADGVGDLLDAALRTTTIPVGDTRGSIVAELADHTRLPIEDFLRRSISIDLHVESGELVAIPRRPFGDGQAADLVSGRAVDELIRTVPIDVEPIVLGGLVLDLLDRVRAVGPVRQQGADRDEDDEQPDGDLDRDPVGVVPGGGDERPEHDPDHGDGPVVDTDAVFAALQRHVLPAGARIEERRDWPEGLSVLAGQVFYGAVAADWLVAGEPWVGDAVRVVADTFMEHVPVEVYGLLLDRAGEAWFLNDVATMRALGRRLGDELDPLAYAELLAEFHSGPQTDDPVATALAPSHGAPAGVLVRDVDEVASKYPFVDAGLLAPPVVRRTGDEIVVQFRSVYYYLDEMFGAADVLRWTVSGGGGRPVTWLREYAAQRIERGPAR